MIDLAFETQTLRNGLRIVRAPAAAPDVVAIRAIVDAGQGREPTPGLSHMIGRTLCSGAGTRDEDAWNDAFERHGITVDTSGVGFGIKALTEDAQVALELAVALLRAPHFNEDAVARERQRAANEQAAELDLPRVHAARAFLEAIYGDHPLGRDPRGDPAALTRDDLVRYHESFFAPNETVLAVAGGADLDALCDALEDWSPQRAPARRRNYPMRKSRDIRVERDTELCHLYLGHLGVERLDPDWHALRVLDHVLGTGPGFTDRLSRRLRDELGLVYHVSGSISTTAGRSRGLFQIALTCAHEDAEQAEAEARAILAELCTQPVEAVVLEEVKNYLAASYVFDFVTTEDRATAGAAHVHFDLGVDYPARYLSAIAQVDPIDLLAAAQRHIHPDQLVAVRT